MKTLVNICSLIGLGACLLYFSFGCATARKSERTTTIITAEGQSEQPRFAPLDLPADFEIVPEKYPQQGDIYGTTDSATQQQSSDSWSADMRFAKSPDTVDTLNNQAYRIQIFTSKLYGEARHAMTVAEEIFDRNVFLDYEVPYYKVRVGSFRQREEAEEYLQRVKAAGYPDAWIVIVNVGVKEPEPLYPEGTPSVIDSTESQQGGESDD
jgi:hypothetical protein